MGPITTSHYLALSAALLPAISGLFFQDRRPGIYAALLSILLPLTYLFPQYENKYVAAGLLVFCLASARLARRGGPWRGLAAGALAGLLLLLNPAAVSILVSWMLYLLWRGEIASPLRFGLYAGCATMLVLTPWTWRNYTQFQKFFFIRNNLGLELHVSNNDLAEASFYLNHVGGDHLLVHPNNSLDQAAEVRRLGEIRYNQQQLKTALDWIRNHPARFLRLTATRIRMFWLPDTDNRPWHSRSIWFVTLAGTAGILLLAVRRQPIRVFFAAALSVYPMLYYVVQADMRYAEAILWILLLGSGYLITSISARVTGKA